LRNSFPALLLVLVLLPIAEASSQTTADPQLVTAIANIKAINLTCKQSRITRNLLDDAQPLREHPLEMKA